MSYVEFFLLAKKTAIKLPSISTKEQNQFTLSTTLLGLLLWQILSTHVIVRWFTLDPWFSSQKIPKKFLVLGDMDVHHAFPMTIPTSTEWWARWGAKPAIVRLSSQTLGLRCIRSTTWSPSFRNKQTQEGCSSISKPMRVNDGHNESGNISISCTGPGIGQAFHTKKGMTKVAPVKLNCSACGQFIVDAWCQTAGDGWWEVYARAHNCMSFPLLGGDIFGNLSFVPQKRLSHIFTRSDGWSAGFHQPHARVIGKRDKRKKIYFLPEWTKARNGSF